MVFIAYSMAFLVIFYKGKSTLPLSLKVTNENLSFFFKFETMVFVACFIRSSLDKPCYSLTPSEFLTCASLAIELEMSITQTTSF